MADKKPATSFNGNAMRAEAKAAGRNVVENPNLPAVEGATPLHPERATEAADSNKGKTADGLTPEAVK